MTLIDKQGYKGDLSSEGKSSLYFDMYFFLIRNQLLQERDMGELTEDDLPTELRNIQKIMDCRSQDHVAMYVDMISRMPRTQYTR